MLVPKSWTESNWRPLDPKGTQWFRSPLDATYHLVYRFSDGADASQSLSLFNLRRWLQSDPKGRQSVFSTGATALKLPHWTEPKSSSTLCSTPRSPKTSPTTSCSASTNWTGAELRYPCSGRVSTQRPFGTGRATLSPTGTSGLWTESYTPTDAHYSRQPPRKNSSRTLQTSGSSDHRHGQRRPIQHSRKPY